MLEGTAINAEAISLKYTVFTCSIHAFIFAGGGNNYNDLPYKN